MSHFALLKDPDRYEPTDWDLLADGQARAYWLEHFEKGFAQAMQYAAKHYGGESKAGILDATKRFSQALAQLRQDPRSLFDGRLTVFDLDRLREGILNEAGLHDPYGTVKDRANAAAAALYPEVVRTLHAMDDDAKWLYLVESVFAGNLFDLGSTGETPLAGGEPDEFLQAVENVRPRPWLADDYDALAEALLQPVPLKWGKAVFFVDNAGADFVLGAMPLARELALRGVQVVLAANEGPSLNDVTADEAVAVVQDLAAADQDLAALIDARMFEVASTGSEIPLLDLSDVSDELNEAAADADLVVLEGMGRAVESNFNVRMKVDCVHLALLKNPQVAARVGGEMYDCICKYAPAE